VRKVAYDYRKARKQEVCTSRATKKGEGGNVPRNDVGMCIIGDEHSRAFDWR